MVHRLSGQAVHRLSGRAVLNCSGQAVHKLSGRAVRKLTGQAVSKVSAQAAHRLSRNPAVNPISAGSHGSWYLCTLVLSRVGNQACSGAVHLASSPPPIPLFFSLPLFHQCDGCLEWRLMAGLRGFASHGGSILSRGWLATVEAPGYPRHPPST